MSSLPTLDEIEEAQASILTESRAAIARAAKDLTPTTLDQHLDILEKLARLSQMVSRCRQTSSEKVSREWREVQAFTRLLPLEVREALHSSLVREDEEEGNGLEVTIHVLAPSRQAACRVLGRVLNYKPDELERKIFQAVAACLDADEGVWLQKP